MIIVTGPGRSGTSLLASLYHELGFDPGGGWSKEIRAGFEETEVRKVNDGITWDLRVTMARPPRPATSPRVVTGGARAMARALRRPRPERVRRRADAAYKDARMWINRRLRPDLLPRWERFDEIVEKYRPRILELSRTRPVVKDPRFSWTLRVWGAAGADIEHVLVTTRPLEAMLGSRVQTGLHALLSPEDIRHTLIYGLGSCLTAIYEFGLDHDVVRFPEFLSDPEGLYRAMRFPEPVSYETFERGFRKVIDPDLVRH